LTQNGEGRLIEIYSPSCNAKAISPVDFTDLNHLAERLLTFQDCDNTAATPVDWTLQPRRPQHLPPPHRLAPRPSRITSDELEAMTFSDADVACGRGQEPDIVSREDARCGLSDDAVRKRAGQVRLLLHQRTPRAGRCGERADLDLACLCSGPKQS
jgi:hypothetical protein